MKDLTLTRMYQIVIILLLFLPNSFYAQERIASTKPLSIDYEKSTIRSRFMPPKGYHWMSEVPGSFGEFLQNFELYPENFPVRDYREIPLGRQFYHAAILKIDVGTKDLQQCADAWMRLYAEYLWKRREYSKIVFHFTSGQPMSWLSYRDGVRTTEDGERVKFHKTAKFDDSYANFRKYLNLVFAYAGTISLDRESLPVLKNEDIRTGDYLIVPGSPGHATFIVGIARNAAGKRLYLLAESFMPAQDIHIIVNPFNKRISPWYELDVKSPKTYTAKYIFSPTSVKRFYQLAELEE